MKKSHYLLTAIVFALLLSSCGSLSISQKRYSRGLNIDWFAKKDEKKSVPAAASKKKSATIASSSPEKAADAVQSQVIVPEDRNAQAVETSNTPVVASLVKKRVAVPSRPEFSKKEIRQIARSAKQQIKSEEAFRVSPMESTESGDVSTVLLVILCIIAPLGILAVALHEGEINTKFLISILLHLLFILPGIIYSLLVVLDVV